MKNNYFLANTSIHLSASTWTFWSLSGKGEEATELKEEAIEVLHVNPSVFVLRLLYLIWTYIHSLFDFRLGRNTSVVLRYMVTRKRVLKKLIDDGFVKREKLVVLLPSSVRIWELGIKEEIGSSLSLLACLLIASQYGPSLDALHGTLQTFAS
ncbi:hypothetical protein YC2023_046660 [Brassica napus]